MPGTALDLLELARTRLGLGWTQGAEARDVNGKPTDPWRAEAAEWSLLGAIVAAYEQLAYLHPGFGLEQLATAVHRLTEFVDDDSLADWNDAAGRTQAEAQAALGSAARVEQANPTIFVFSRN